MTDDDFTDSIDKRPYAAAVRRVVASHFPKAAPNDATLVLNRVEMYALHRAALARRTEIPAQAADKLHRAALLCKAALPDIRKVNDDPNHEYVLAIEAAIRTLAPVEDVVPQRGSRFDDLLTDLVSYLSKMWEWNHGMAPKISLTYKQPSGGRFAEFVRDCIAATNFIPPKPITLRRALLRAKRGERQPSKLRISPTRKNRRG